MSFKNNHLIIGFPDLQWVQKIWTLEDIAVFEKMLHMVKKARKNQVTISKRGFQIELRVGRRTLEKSLDCLSRAGLIILLDGCIYSIGEIPVIVEKYYKAGREIEFTAKLKYYLDKPFGKFSIASKKAS